MAVVTVEAESAADDALADQIVAVGEVLDDCAVLQFVDHLRVAGRVVGVDEIVGCYSSNGFGDAIAVAVVDKTSDE